jgi:transposase
MNNLQKLPLTNHTSSLPVFVDISKDHLDYTIGWESGRSPAKANRIEYRVDVVQQWITELITDYQLSGGQQLEFICEPTGGLQHKLLLVARRNAANVRYVDSERMYNARMITYGNGEKTDEKDPGAMRNLYLIGRHRPAAARDVLRQTVRSISQEYEELSQQAVRARNKIHGLLGYVFVDYNKSASFTFSRSGRALAKEFSFCPQYIIQAGYEAFTRRLKAHVPRIRTLTLQQIWTMAQSSVAITDTDFPDPRLDYMVTLYEQWVRLEDRKSALKERLADYGKIYQEQGLMPGHLPPNVSPWMLVRVIAETGSLDGFEHIRQLWAYLGLKLARRQSGKYKGHIKITKKGSSLARKLLFQICLPLVKKDTWLHSAYKRQNPKGKRGGKGIRAMTSMMRKFVKIILAMHQSGDRFRTSRLGCCESQYHSEMTPQ